MKRFKLAIITFFSLKLIPIFSKISYAVQLLCVKTRKAHIHNRSWRSKFQDKQLAYFFKKLGEVPFLLDKSKPKGNENIPAGYTYLGQFLAHEMSFNANSFTDLHTVQGPKARTPAIDLDSVYGQGPIREPIYYDQEQYGGRLYLSLSHNKTQSSSSKVFDFNRISQKKDGIATPVIPDMRNDENILVAHIHLAVLKFHNATVDAILSAEVSKDEAELKGRIKQNLQQLSQKTPAIKFPICDEIMGKLKSFNLATMESILIKSPIHMANPRGSRRRIRHSTPPSIYHSSKRRERSESIIFPESIKQLQNDLLDIIIRYLIANSVIKGSQGDKGHELEGVEAGNIEIIAEELTLVKAIFPNYDSIDAYIDLSSGNTPHKGSTMEETIQTGTTGEPLASPESYNPGQISSLPAQADIDTLFDQIFALAKRETIWHFQWVVLSDFLPRIVGESMMEKLQPDLKNIHEPDQKWTEVQKFNYLRLNRKPLTKLPRIFTGAFFRFGHFMVLNQYKFVFKDLKKGKPSPNGHILSIKKSFKPIEANIRLSTFFWTKKDNSDVLNKSSVFKGFINLVMAENISTIQQQHHNNIVVRNLRQTAKMHLPSIQDFVKYELREPIKILDSSYYLKNDDEVSMPKFNFYYEQLGKTFPEDLKWGKKENDFSFKNFLDHAPPWFYMGLEAFIISEGNHLGPLAGQVVAEVLIKILQDDENSILGKANVGWKPHLNGSSGKYTMIDFLTFAGMYD